MGSEEEPETCCATTSGQGPADRAGDSLARIVAELNLMLKGVFGYLEHAFHGDLETLDGFIRAKSLQALLRKQGKRPAFGPC